MPEETTGSPPARPHRGLEFGVLGPVQVLADGRPIPLGRPGMRALLAMLVLEANQVVPIDRLVDGLWQEDPPATARTIVHGYVSRLRRLFEENDPTGSARILTRAPGYQLGVDPARLDVNRAMALVEDARGRPPEVRAGLLREALGLWRGPVLADVPGRPITADLDELRLSAIEERIDAELDLGRHLELVGELRQLVIEHPYRERLVGHVMRALYRAGRRADALAAYQQFQHRAGDELGIDPGPDLRALHEQVLRDDPVLWAEAAAGTLPPRVGVVVPAQLPPADSGFTGRTDELAWLDELRGARQPGSAAIGVLTGPAGVGKSALAVTWAHRVADQFPDGQLYAALRGFDPQRDPVDPTDLLARFLLALGVPADGVPEDPEDRATLYRSLLARRRVLVLLDDARDAEQVRPLLPASAGSLVLVTSRRRLDGLAVRSGAAVLPVGTLDEDTALALITRAAPEVDPVHAGKLAELCGYLPLALRVAVARLAAATEPGWTVTDLVAEMSDDHHRLRSLSLADDDTGVGQVLAVSCRGLPAPDRALFELFGAVPVATLTPHAAAALAETPTTTARDRLRRLADAHLVTETPPDRFAMHDLVRLHARRLAEDGLTPAQRAAARDRLTGYYLVVADQARRLLRPAHDELDLAARDGGRTARPDLVTPTQAMSWFHGEWTNLVALVHAATEHGAQRPAWQLVRLLQHYCAVRSTADEWFALVRLGLAAARAAGDKVGQVLMLDTLYAAHQRFGRLAHALGDAEQAHRIATELGQPSYLGLAHAQVGGVLHAQRRDQEALVHYRRALELARELGDPLGQARGLNNVAQVERALGDRRAAARHQAAALDLAETLGDGDYLLVAVTNLAELHAELGELAEAEALARRGVVLAAQAGNLAQTAFARKVLGQVLAELGRTAAARAELTEARRLYLRLNSRRATEVERRLAALRSDV